MQPGPADAPRPGCLLFVVQATAPMGEVLSVSPWPGRPPPNKMRAAALLVNATIEGLLALPPDGRPLDVGVLAYQGDDTGRAVLQAPLPGATIDAPLVLLESLRRPDQAARPGRVRRWVSFVPSGDVPADNALAAAAAALQRWLARPTPSGPPLVVHICDGRGPETAARLCRLLAALATPTGNTILAHCVLTADPVPRIRLPTAEADVPDGPWKALWPLSSLFRPTRRTQRETRALSVNDFPVRPIVRLVERLTRLPAAPDAIPADGPGEDGGRFEHRVLWLPKSGNSAEECEDVRAVDEGRRLAALSDGAGSGIFSRLWAELLTRSLLDERPALGDPAALARWLGTCRERWLAAINFPSLRYTQQLRVRNAGAGATLLTLQLTRHAAAADAVSWTAWAVGDTCLFWVRDNRLLATFPAARAADFGLRTPLLQTTADRPVITPLLARGMGKLGDLFLLSTDATAQLLLARCERGAEPDWERFWQVPEAEWRDEMAALRERGDIVDDDYTLLAVRLRRGDDPAP
jgi:hypothetical protein